MSGKGGEVVVADAPERDRFEARVGDEIAGYLAYRRHPDRVTLVHTEVDPAFEGHGVGSGLARFALDDARRGGLRVRVACPFVTAWLLRHPEYGDVVEAAATPGSRTR